MCRLPFTTLAILGLFVLVGDLRAERVGFQFTGALQVGGTGNVTIFGISVPKTAPLTGTFSFDTATQGTEVSPGVQTYHQTICGGFRLNIYDGAIQLAASDYTVTVANDAGTPAADSFSVDYNYDSAAIPPITPEKILVNGTPWNGSRAYIKYYLSWDPSAFMDSELRADLPLTPNPGVTGLVGSSGSPRFFSVNSPSAIVPPSGDYNRDGKLDSCDYTEWRKVFGETLPSSLYADGNNDGEVDAADYIIWRKASTAGPGSGFAMVPEPDAITTIVTGLVLFAWRAMPWQRGERRR